MNSDKELIASTQRLKEIALNHSKNGHSDEELEEACDILKKIGIYAHQVGVAGANV